MRIIKMLGLAAVMALATTAFLGAGSASATVLCSTAPEGEVCPEEGVLYEGTTLEASAKDVKFAEAGYGSSDLICKTSELTVMTASMGGEGEAVAGEVSQLNFAGCKSTAANVSCTIAVTNLPYEASIEHTVEDDGLVTISNGGSGEPGFDMSCLGNPCHYSFGTFNLPLSGGSPASLIALRENTVKTSGFCGGVTNSSWTGTYTIAEPSAVFVASS
jgi:hypothetical protein